MKCEAYNVEINNIFELVTLLLIVRVCLLRSRNPIDVASSPSFLFLLSFPYFFFFFFFYPIFARKDDFQLTSFLPHPFLRSLRPLASCNSPWEDLTRLQDVGIASYERVLTFFPAGKVDPNTFYRSAWVLLSSMIVCERLFVMDCITYVYPACICEVFG